MKRVLIGALAAGSLFAGSAAIAGQTDDVLARLEAIEKENAALRKENAALLENKMLRQKNTSLKSASLPQHAALPGTQAASLPTAQAVALPATDSAKSSDVFGAYAADLPLSYKGRIAETRGLFRAWAEGGAILTGGDPVSQDFTLANFSGLGALGGIGGGIPGTFNLTPKVGWEVATGFDYRFASSPWHVSGQFRYGEGGKTSGAATSAGNLDPVLVALIASSGDPLFAGLASAGGSETFAANYKETHWLADLAVGRDVLGSGPSAMQVKGGIRVSEFVSTAGTSDVSNFFLTYAPPLSLPPFTFSAINSTTTTVTSQRNSFLGAGPRFGIEGSVPFAGKWGFEYLGDAALLFGTQKSLNTATTVSAVSPAILAGIFGSSNNTVSTFTSERFATVFNADIQVGVSYWITQNVKLTGSYRLDAWINVQNQSSSSVSNLTPDRYIHGPRLAVSGQF